MLRAKLSGSGHLNADFIVRQGRDRVVELTATNVPSGSFAEVTVPQGVLAENGSYRWSVRASDGRHTSKWVGDCGVGVDSVAPEQPVVSSLDYPTSGFSGSPGRTGVFTFSPGGSTDVVRYGWSLNTDTTGNQVDANGSVDVPITPSRSGPNSLYVRAYDRAGNPSAVKIYIFMVADAPRPSTPVAVWKFDETDGTSAADSTGHGNALTLNGATFGPGYSNNGQVNTAGSFSSTSSAIVDTSRAFSVSAWVRLDDTTAAHTVASQGNGFSLRYADARWSFGGASSVTSPRAGEWTHLAGSYEPGKVSLYVNGKLEGTATETFAGATGPFVLGSGQAPSAIDHVQVWSRALTAAEAATHNNLVVLRARYSMDELAGTTTSDEVSGQSGTLSGGVGWASTPADPDDPNQIWTSADKWLRFDGSGTGEMTGPRPADLRTDRSYSVSAWVRVLDDGVTAGTVVGMGDSFALSREADTSRWSFRLADGTVIFSFFPPMRGSWVHLVATYDATTGATKLYVDRDEQPPAQPGPQLAGAGDLQIGRGIVGDIDDVRFHRGVMTEDDVFALFSASNHR
ncbi:LamG domain-containing protein [Streptomyces sp. ID05-26A]|nr:LamG domain-containing protein [Streptomyces sp. ID05-26A]